MRIAQHRQCVDRCGGDVAFEDFGRDFALVGRHRHAFGHIFQLSHVARPGILEQHLLGFLVQSHGGHVVSFAHFECKLAEEHVDVVASFAQRRHVYGHGRESVVEILAKSALGNGALHVHVGGSDDAHVGAFHFARSHGDELPRFEHAQQADLCLQGQFADLVEKKRSAVGGRKITLTPAYTSREGAFDVSEKFGVDGAFGQCATVEGEIFFSFAGAGIVDDAREHLLADAVFALDENRKIDACDFECRFERTIQGIAVAHDAVTLFDGL